MASLPSDAADARLASPAAKDGHRALPRPMLPERHRYTGRMPAWAWIVLFGLLIGLALPVFRTSSVTESASELRALEAERERLTSEIRSLAAHVGQLGSLARIQQQAVERLRMVNAMPTTVLEVDSTPPARTLPARFLPAADSSGAGRPLAGGARFEPDSHAARPVWRAILDVLVFD